MTDMSLTVDGSVYVFAQADLQYRGLCDAGSGSEGWTKSSGWNARPVSVAARFVVRLVACALQIDEGDMLSGRRGTAEVARARQIAMYLLHTSLSVSYMDVADMFGRDRTTVSHACRTVEDLRDDPMHDDMLLKLDEMVDLARSMSRAELHVAGQADHEPDRDEPPAKGPCPTGQRETASRS